MTTPGRTPREPAEPGRWARWTVWLAGLAVALGAGVATAHGLYEVALAAGTPKVLAWLYPLITDGLALVAYATTARLADHGRRYAWTVVVAAAGLSGLTQASYLAGGVAAAPPALRFAIGAWPAIAAAIVAHLLFLLGTTNQPPTKPDDTAGAPLPVAAASAESGPPVLPPLPQAVTSTSTALPQRTLRDAQSTAHSTPHPAIQTAVQPDLRTVYNAPPVEHSVEHPAPSAPVSVVRATAARDAAPARVRAHTAATGHATAHGQLPTVTELMALAQVARGTAAAALKDLRQQPTQPQRHQISSSTDEQTASR
ncbi:MAG: hypothetical protein DLM61_18095 [Pseudonocardiales bacterium]|nr:MAG: hypothetical protein DLM61_18095 [Pseudonocardiales bacterium]